MEPLLISFRLNGKEVGIHADPCLPAIDLLREECRLSGVKKGCGEGECGSCTILLDGKAVCSCILLSGQLEGADIVTIEGLNDTLSEIVKNSFVDSGAVQCGFCTPGMIISVVSLLKGNHYPSEEEIKEALSGHLCRCTGYVKIIDAVKHAAETINRKGTS
jgi:carbon-monoxide dehydrogenase small subunit